MPAIVIGDKSDSAEANLGLARQLRFLKICHTDEVHAPATVHLGFRPGRELGPFHADIGSPTFDPNIDVPSGLLDDVAKLRTDGVRETDVYDNPVAKESRGTSFRPVIKLVGQNDVERPQSFFERADGACR